MDFPFDVKHLFPQPIICVQPQHLRPSDPGCKLSRILNTMGQFSARAQGLNHSVTVAEKLAGDQVVYLIADEDSGRMAVTGLLKVGTKDLFLYDETGHIHRSQYTPAVLDFYVHETRQRRGQGKRLFEHMLAEQGWRAVKCSVDRPSHKLIGFLEKHYGLTRIIPQTNKFVLFEGFFGEKAPPTLQGQLAGSNQVNSRSGSGSGSGAGSGAGPREEPSEEPQGHGRQRNPVTAPPESSVADAMGAGDRISNRPGKQCPGPSQRE